MPRILKAIVGSQISSYGAGCQLAIPRASPAAPSRPNSFDHRHNNLVMAVSFEAPLDRATDLRHADLWGVDFSRPDIRNFTFNGADLRSQLPRKHPFAHSKAQRLVK